MKSKNTERRKLLELKLDTLKLLEKAKKKEQEQPRRTADKASGATEQIYRCYVLLDQLDEAIKNSNK